jgi:hypothetical protein
VVELVSLVRNNSLGLRRSDDIFRSIQQICIFSRGMFVALNFG